MKGHLPMEDLLEVRDGEGSAEASAHAASCRHCAGEVERLRDVASALRALPEPEMEGDRWPQVKAALDAEERAWIPKAVAATNAAVTMNPKIATGQVPVMPTISLRSRFTSNTSLLWSQVLPGQNHIQPGPRISVPMTTITHHSTMNPKMKVQMANFLCLYV